MDNRDKIIDKIQKLLALATSPNEHEAAAAANKAQELLLNYKLTMADIEGADVNMREPIEQYNMPMGVNQWRAHAWCDILIGSVAKVTFCNVLQHSKGRVYVLIGKSTDVAVAKEMYWFLFHQCERLALEYMRDYGRKDEKAKTGFLLGCATRVGYRLREAFEQQRRANVKVDALMIVESTAVQEYMKKQFPNVKDGREHRGPNDFESFAYGMSAGERVRLRRDEQICGEQQKRLSTTTCLHCDNPPRCGYRVCDVCNEEMGWVEKRVNSERCTFYTGSVDKPGSRCTTCKSLQVNHIS